MRTPRIQIGQNLPQQGSHPTYCEQIDGLLQEVQHMRLSVMEARQLFLQLVDQVALETLEDYIKSTAQEPPKPERPLIHTA